MNFRIQERWVMKREILRGTGEGVAPVPYKEAAVSRPIFTGLRDASILRMFNLDTTLSKWINNIRANCGDFLLYIFPPNNLNIPSTSKYVVYKVIWS